MSSSVGIRLAAADVDATAIAAIYASSVTGSVASFELEPPDAAEMARRIQKTLEWCPWLVATAGTDVAGYAYATRHRERAGYRWAVDLSVYVATTHHGAGIGRRLYESVFAILRLQRFQHGYAGITPPNPASFALHEAMGMTPVGSFDRVGYKFGAWWSVTWLGVQLQPQLPLMPLEPIALPALLATPDGRAQIQAILERS